jgi:hypothetical protein
MPQFATASHIHKVSLQIYLQAARTSELWSTFPTHQHYALSASRSSCLNRSSSCLSNSAILSGSGSFSALEWSERNAVPMAVRTASKSETALGRRPMPAYVIPFAGIPLRRQFLIISPPFPQYWDRTMENSCQLFVVMFNKDASGVSALQHFRKIELKAHVSAHGMPDQPGAICVACDVSPHKLCTRPSVPFGHLGRGTGVFFCGAFRSGTRRCTRRWLAKCGAAQVRPPLSRPFSGSPKGRGFACPTCPPPVAHLLGTRRCGRRWIPA